MTEGNKNTLLNSLHVRTSRFIAGKMDRQGVNRLLLVLLEEVVLWEKDWGEALSESLDQWSPLFG